MAESYRIVQVPSSGGALKAYVRHQKLVVDSVFRGAASSGEWVQIPAIWKLRLTGTGTCIIDSRDALGTVSSSIASYSPASATNQIEYPYAGETAVEVRFTLTGSCIAEVY